MTDKKTVAVVVGGSLYFLAVIAFYVFIAWAIVHFIVKFW